jgi:hypothetical protein
MHCCLRLFEKPLKINNTSLFSCLTARSTTQTFRKTCSCAFWRIVTDFSPKTDCIVYHLACSTFQSDVINNARFDRFQNFVWDKKIGLNWTLSPIRCLSLEPGYYIVIKHFVSPYTSVESEIDRIYICCLFWPLSHLHSKDGSVNFT